MKINWKIRFKNKAWLLAFCGAVLAFIYQVLGLFGILPAVSENTSMTLLGLILNVLAALGVIVDPTTPGAGDSERALGYDVPGGKIENETSERVEENE